MKLTSEQANYIRGKRGFQNEGAVAKIFAYLLKKKLKGDVDFKKAVDNADASMEDLKIHLMKAERNGVIIPDELKKYAKMVTYWKGMKALEKAAFSASYKSVWCAGPSIEFVKKIQPVQEVVTDLVNDYEQAYNSFVRTSQAQL